MRVILLLVVMFITSSTVIAQTVVIKKVELAGEQVIVHYDLEDSNPNNEYLINLYTSKDNYFAALTKVTGDVGAEVKPGTDKKISWKIRDEYGPYKGKLALEIRGKVYVPFVKLQNFDAKKGYKKGVTYQLNWKPGASNPINIELFHGGERVAGDMNLSNNGSHSLFIPKHASNAKDYRIKFTDTKNPDEVIYTDYFKVTPKIPMIVKIGAGVAVAAVLVVVLTQKKSPSEDPGNNNNNTGTDIELPSIPSGGGGGE
jgi:hypothetical protein